MNVEYIANFEVLISVLFFGLFFKLSLSIFKSNISCLSPEYYLYSKYAFTNLFWAIPFLLSILDSTFGIFNNNYYWSWLSNISDTIGSVYLLSYTLVLSYSCIFTNKITYTLRSSFCNKKNCIGRYIVTGSYLIIFLIWTVSLFGLYNEIHNPYSTALSSKESVNIFSYELFFTSIGVCSLAISGLLHIFKIGRKRISNYNFGIGIGLLIFAASDALQPIELYINNSLYLTETNLWWIEWILALIGLIFYYIGSNKMIENEIKKKFY